VRGFAWIFAFIASPAFAEPTPDAPAPPEAKLIAPVDSKPVSGGFSHEGKIGFSARIGVGLRAVATYDPKVYCGTTDTMESSGNARVCVGRAPLALGLELSYGLTRHVDLLAEMQFGLEQDFASTSTASDGPHLVVLAPGARFWFNETARSSLFATAQAVLDFSGYKTVSGADVGVRSLQGYWFDPSKSYGFYFYVSETASFARWIDLELDVGVGFQGRYP
jgi:hypothetical protein